MGSEMQTTTPATGSATNLAATGDHESHITPTPLSDAEKRERDRCEAIIAKGWETFLAVGYALATIRNKRLYRDRHATFEDYCRQKWEFSKSHANRLIEAAVVAAILTPIGVKPTSESQLRPLVDLPPQRIPDAWKKAQELAGGKEITAKVVRQAAEQFKPLPTLPVDSTPKKKRPPQDKTTRVLHLIAQAEKAAQQEDIKSLLAALARIRKRLTS